MKQSTPKRYWPISTESTRRHFEQEYDHHVTALTDALDRIETTNRTAEQRGVWTMTGRSTVSERVVEFVTSAEEEIVYMTVESVLTDEIVDALAAASERGVSIRLADMSTATEAQFDGEIPDATLFDSLWDWAETPAGRLLMVDQEKTLVSVLVPGAGDHPPESRDETAIWGTGSANSLVVVLRALFTWELDGNRE